MAPLVSPEYFKFTVIRSPWTRAVAAFFDKIVKPWGSIVRQPGQPSDELLQLGRMTFNDVVHILHASSDARLEKHWRPQISFIRGVELDYLGSFEHLDRAFDMVGKRLGIDMRESVIPRVRSAKRTIYQAPAVDQQRYYGNVPARELALMEQLPPADAFYDDRTRATLAGRFQEDVVLHLTALMPAGLAPIPPGRSHRSEFGDPFDLLGYLGQEFFGVKVANTDRPSSRIVVGKFAKKRNHLRSLLGRNFVHILQKLGILLPFVRRRDLDLVSGFCEPFVGS